MRQKPRLVVSSSDPSRGSTSSEFTYGGFLEKSTRRSERLLADVVVGAALRAASGGCDRGEQEDQQPSAQRRIAKNTRTLLEQRNLSLVAFE